MTESEYLELKQSVDSLARRVERLERGPTTYGPGSNPPKFTPPRVQ